MTLKNFTKKVTKEKIHEIAETFSRFAVNNPNPNIFMTFKYENVTVSLYYNGTILFQGNDVAPIVDIVISKKNNIEKAVKPAKKLQEVPKFKPLITQDEIGCDEVGVGDYFGGITVCAALVNADDFNKLRKIGVGDSKKLNDQNINRIADIIRPIVQHEIVHVDPVAYNNLYEKYQNSHVIKTFCHNQALVALTTKSAIKIADLTIIMDEYAKPKQYEKYLDVIKPEQRIVIDVFQTKADAKYVSVGAASILARAYWLQTMKDLEAKIKEPVFFGATDVRIKKIAEKIYCKSGLKGLNQAVKLHFNFTEQIINKYAKKT